VESTSRQSALSKLAATVDLEGAALGLQMAISVVVVLFLALVIRLEYPTWAVFTVLMLCMANYVGAVQEKAVLRLIGTIIGGALGFLATGALQQSPMLYLPLTFIVVAFSVSMFGQSRAPYAFFLAGTTYVVIASNSQTDPAMASHYALLRIEEVGLGVVVSMVVQYVVFPRYAVTAFQKLVRASLAEIADMLPLVAGRFAGTNADFGQAMRDFPAKSTQMRMMLRFGAMESRWFRRDIVRNTQKVSHLNIAAALARSSGWSDPAPEPHRTALSGIVADIAGMLREGFLALEDDKPLSETWKTGLAELWSRLDAKITELRAQPDSKNLPAFETAGISIHLLNLRELSELVLEMDLLNHTEPENNTRSESLSLAPAWPSMPWIHRGIRAAIATVFALVVENWLNPPGGTMMLLVVYTFTALNAMSPDESGDRPAFRQVLVFFLVLAGASILLLATTPMMASYSVLNIVIAAWAFLFGYWFHRAGGVSVPLTFSFLLLVGVVSLNSQEPVGFQSIAGFFFGFMNGLVISAVAQRLLWPVLPQKNLGVGLQRYLATMLEGIDSGMASLPLWRRAEHALFPAKGKKAIALMAGPTCPPDEVRRLEEFLNTLQELSWEFSLCTGRLKPILPPEFADRGGKWIADARGIFRSVLTELSDSMASVRQPRDLGPAIDQELLEWDKWMDWLRPAIREHQTPIETSIQLMGFSSRFRAAMLALRRALDQARGLNLRDYMGDVSV
jgi:uncharacterized membrane protein YccC